MFSLEKVSETEIMLVVTGSLYGEAAAEFERRLEGLAQSDYPTNTLDLSLALGITSSAIGKLLSVRKKLMERNKTIRIKGCNETLYETFVKIKLNSLIEISR
ncbi:MAG TPA: STAS domain-containing protein [Spirochaetia bacterium]|nr:STAS domain-containing protein [Spirochaetia bacterium]